VLFKRTYKSTLSEIQYFITASSSLLQAIKQNVASSHNYIFNRQKVMDQKSLLTKYKQEFLIR
jgi:hypothetical protein